MRIEGRFGLAAILALACIAVTPRSAAAAPGPAAVQAATAVRDADAQPELARLRSEIETLRREYEARLRELEQRLVLLEQARPESAESAPQPVAAAPSSPAYGAAGAKVFNPDIAVVGSFVGAAGEGSADDAPSLEMRETEISFQAAVDPYARADFFLSVGTEEVGLEEGYLTFPTLPAGLLVRVGKMRGAFGRLNAMHTHVLPFVDRPLVSTNLLGGEEGLADSGVSVSRLLQNPWLFLEATAQVYRGQSAVFSGESRADLAWVGHLRAYRDLGESVNLDLGGSFAYGHNDAAAGSDLGAGLASVTPATTRLLGADATFRYRPLRRSIYTHLLARAELVWSRRRAGEAAAEAFGGYAYLEYQLARRFTLGLRYDDSERASDPALRDRGGSFLLTFKPSEFSQLRAQLRRTRLAGAHTTSELLVQALFGIGTHAAHPF